MKSKVPHPWPITHQESPFTLDQLQVVRAIAQHGSFRRAADSLYISQPAVSLQVQNLEKQLGTILFDRSARKVQLTEAGHMLLSYSNRILGLCQEASRAIRDLQDLKRGTLALGASQTVGTYVMPRLIGQFRQLHPNVLVQLHVQSTRRITHRVASGDLDVAIVGGEIPYELRQSLEVVPFDEDEFVLVTAAVEEGRNATEVWLMNQQCLQKNDLQNLPFIMLDSQSSTRHTIDLALGRYGLDPDAFRVEMELSSLEAIKNAVRAGLGVAFLSRVTIEQELSDGHLRRLEVEGIEIKRTLWLVTNPARYQSQSAQVFRKQLLQRQTLSPVPA
ncbi:MAG: LysR family transcriptional regulator [Synechococcales cyanobacterium]